MGSLSSTPKVPQTQVIQVPVAAPAHNAADEAELSSMMRDPKYWRDKDPSFVAKVTEGFQNLYGK